MVPALHHRQGRLADGEHIAGLKQAAGITLQHRLGIVEHPQQVGAHGQHPTALPLPPLGGVGGQGLGFLEGNEDAVASPEATEGSVVDPVEIDPEGVEQGFKIDPGGAHQGEPHAGSGALATLDDVSRPVAVGAGLLIGMEGGDAHPALHLAEIAAAKQHRFDPQLGHEHLHARMGVADRDLAADLQALGAASHLEGCGDQLQWRSGAKAMAQLQNQEAEAGEQQQNEQEGEGGRHSETSRVADRRSVSARRP